MHSADDQTPERSWAAKFRDALRGAKVGVRGQSSFFVHFFFAAAVVAAAAIVAVNVIEWCILLLCITIVLTAEMFNTALEWIARSAAFDQDPHLGRALDIGSAAVLIASIGAALVGLIIFGPHLVRMVGWW